MSPQGWASWCRNPAKKDVTESKSLPKAPAPWWVSLPQLLCLGAGVTVFLGSLLAARRDAQPSAGLILPLPVQFQQAQSEFASSYKYLTEQQSPQRV